MINLFSQEVMNDDESTPYDDAAAIARVVQSFTREYYGALDKARQRILAGEEQFSVMLDEMSKLKAKEIAELDRINRQVALTQNNEQLLATLREMRAASVRDWNVLNAGHDTAEAALNAYLGQHAIDYQAYIPRSGFGKALTYAGWVGDAAQLGLALSSGDDAELGKAVGGLLLGYVGAGIGLMVAGSFVAVPAIIGAAIVGVFSVLFSFIPDWTEDVELWGELGSGIKSIFRDDIKFGENDASRYKFGSADDDTMVGTDDASNIILSGGGNDSIRVYSGDGNILDGGIGSDTITGWDKGDALVGGSGGDTLTGGGGDDTLEGGFGNDVYMFSSEDLQDPTVQDVIFDADGVGKILFNNLDISGTGIGFDNIRHASLGSWETSDGSFRLAVIGEGDGQSLLLIRRFGDGKVGGRIVIKNWSNGDLGISLPGFDETQIEPTLSLSDGDDLFGASGNNSGNDSITGLAGNDGINGGAGADVLEGGIGSDLIFGGAGDDKLYGGEGNDVIIDGSETVNMREWDQTQSQYHEDKIAQLGSAVVARGKAWYIYRSDENASTGDATQDGSRMIAVPDSDFSVDPNALPSGDDFIDAGNGSDMVRAGEGDDTIIGGAGNDLLIGGHDNDVINGGDDDDEIYGDLDESTVPGAHFSGLVSDQAEANGNDILDGGAGNDTILGQGGNDVIYGGDGNDVLRGSGLERTIDSDDADSDYIDGGLGDDQISGDDGDDTLLGGDGADVIRGDQEKESTRSGNDTIDGGAGDDVIQGDGGNDTIMGGDGADIIVGDAEELDGSKHGHDTISGGADNDEIQGQGGDDVLFGGEGNDLLIGDLSQDRLAVEFHGNDQLFGGAGDDELQGGAGDDLLDGGADNDLLFGQAGDDQLLGGAGDDSLNGNEGNDRLYGGDGIDGVYGQGGDDFLDGGAGDDTIGGGAGKDTLVGGSGNDLMSGHGGNDVLDGGANDDVLMGGAGDDILDGGSGNDRLRGGTGNDTYVFNKGWGHDRVLGLGASDAGVDTIRFGSGIDPNDVTLSLGDNGSLMVSTNDGIATAELAGFFGAAEPGHHIEFADGTQWNREDVAAQISAPGNYTGTAGNDTIAGKATDDAINGYLGDDILHGGAGSDVIYGGMDDSYNGTATDDDALFGGAGADRLYGERGSDRLDGGIGDDKLYGGAEADYLAGGEGNDELLAGQWTAVGSYMVEEGSDDILEGGSGDDILNGGLGINRYRFAPGFGDDRLFLTERPSGSPESVSAERAVLEFAAGITASSLSLTMSGEDLVIASETDSITIVNFNKRAEASVEFSFADGSSLGSEQAALLTTRTGTRFNESLAGSSLDDHLYGLGGDDKLYGLAGDDILVGGAGDDYLEGGAGDDIYRFGLDQGNDWITGIDYGGFDTLELGAGISQEDVSIYGYGTNDMYVMLETTGSYVRVSQGQEVDRIVFADGFVMDRDAMAAASQVKDFELTFSGQEGPLVGNRYSNTFKSTWSSGKYTVVAAIGGAGDDRYWQTKDPAFYTTLDVVENENEGNDTVYAAGYKYTLPDNVENIIVLYNDTVIEHPGTGERDPREFVGNALNNVIDASNAGNSLADNRLDGGAGADTLIGSGRADTYVVDNEGDIVVESLSDGGVDAVESSISFSLADHEHIENLMLTGSGAISATGNASDNVLDGQASTAANLLEGGLGNDTYRVDKNDTVVERAGEGTDTTEFYANNYDSVETFSLSEHVENGALIGDVAANLKGNALDNILTGTVRDNVLDGGAGNDTLEGGKGNDSYYIDSLSDTVIEAEGAGIDTVFSALDYTLGENLDHLTMLSGAVEGVGNVLSNVISGNGGNNRLYGRAGHDRLHGKGGSDELYGGAGFDRLDGGSGADFMVGGKGNDTYIVDDAGDVVDEQAGEGTDTVQSSISYTLPSALEYLTLTGNSDLDGSGNASVNVIRGNGGANTLSGYGGNDVLDGGGDNDVLIGGSGDDHLSGGSGDDEYVYGGGQDTIDNSDGGYDGIFFNDGIDESRLGFSRDGDDLLVTVDADPNSTVRVTGHFLGGNAAIDYVQPDGSSLLDTATINALADSGGDPGGGVPGDDSDYSNVVDGTASGEQLLGSNDRDLMHGLGGDDTMFAFGGDDKLEGGDGNDDLYGGNGSFSGSGNDILIGGAGSDSLKGEDGDDYLMGGAGDDNYYYAAGSGRDTIDNTGGGSDYVYFASIARERLSFHRDGDDLLVRVDDDMNQEVRVLEHFQGGEYAIAFVQPDDGGYAIPASQFEDLLTPMTATTSSGDMAGAFEPAYIQYSRAAAREGEGVPQGLFNELAYLDKDAASLSPLGWVRNATNWTWEQRISGLRLGQSDGFHPEMDMRNRQGNRNTSTADNLAVTSSTISSDLVASGDSMGRHHVAALRLDAGTLTEASNGNSASSARRELDLLIDIMSGYSAGAVTTVEPDQHDPRFRMHELGGGALRRNLPQGMEQFSIIEP